MSEQLLVASGQIWLNTNKKRRYIVNEVITEGDPVVKYSPLVPESPDDGPYERPLSEWFGANRNGEVRFRRILE